MRYNVGMANTFNFALAVANTPPYDGWCETYAEWGFLGHAGVYLTAYDAFLDVPAGQVHNGTPPNDGNYYVLYWNRFNPSDAGDVSVYRNGNVWSGADATRFRQQNDPATFSYYSSWVGRQFLGWSGYLGSIDITGDGPTPPTPPVAQGNQRKRTYYNILRRQGRL